jgi:16S rRNA A1518/A1519 N6-dimethyltransferase RsmA/KsgA/DIM1 with predicted DNA glycosylase/AP lyase activity
MFLWLIIDAILLLIIIFLFLLLSMFWPPDSPWAPWWRTNKQVARAMCCLARVSQKDIVYDLGCGDGEALNVAAEEHGAKGVGIEIDPLRYLFSKIRFKIRGLNKKVKIIKKDFHDVNISQASVIFVYLVPNALERLRPKFLKELRSGTLLVSFRYKINLPLVAYDKTNDIYLYKLKK